MLKTICYISDSCSNESIEELNALYTKAKINNAKHNITGVLIYKNKNFLQVLEGPLNTVDSTFKKISQDLRHKNIFKVINTNVDQRIFEDYNFGFTIINNKSELKNLHNYLDWLRDANNTSVNKVISMVENFIKRRY